MDSASWRGGGIRFIMKKGLQVFFAGLIVFMLFARTAAFSYIGLDDAAYTFRNPFVAGGLSVSNVVESFTNFRHGGIWMPVTYISYMLDASVCRLTGIPLMGEMHLVNVLLHVMNFLLLWRLLGLLFYRKADSHHPVFIIASAAVFWALHPLRAEPVAWIAARKELLWTLFSLAGLICWTKACCRSTPDVLHQTTAAACLPSNAKQSIVGHQLSAVFFCALACLSKPTAMCFPFLAALVEWRQGKSEPQMQMDIQPFRRLLVRYLPFLLMAAVTAMLAAYSQTHVAGQDSTALLAMPFCHRLVNAFSALGFYLRATVLPAGLHVDCRAVSGIWPIGAGWNFIALAVAIIALGIVAVRCCRHSAAGNRQPSTFNPQPSTAIIFSVFWFLVSLLPTLGLFGSFGIEAHADRFAYLPSMAFSFLICALCGLPQVDTIDFSHKGYHGGDRSRCMMISSCFFAILFLSVVTFCQLSHWRDDWAAHERALACDPEHPRAMVHVADARCSRKRDFSGGISLYRKALSRMDDVPSGGFDTADVRARLAYALASRGNYDDFQEVKRIGTDVLRDFRLDRRGMMLDALGTAFMVDGEYRRAALLFKASIDAPARFWPKASTMQKLKECKCQ